MGNETSRPTETERKRETEGIWEAAMAHYAALPEYRKQELQYKFTEIDSDGDGEVSPGEYLDYITERRYRSDLFLAADKNRDGMLDFDGFLTLHFIYNCCGYYTSCDNCSVVLLGIHFVCVKCYDAGKAYDLCCKCYGNKSYSHLDDHTYFSDNCSLLRLRRPNPASAAYRRKREMEGTREAAKASYAAMPESGKQEVRNRLKSMDINGDGTVSRRDYLDYVPKCEDCSEDFFDVLDKDEDGKLDFDECLALDFISEGHVFSRCCGCHIPLLGTYFVCVKCYDAGETYELCCRCYGDKSCNHHADDQHYFKDIQRLLKLRKPKRTPWLDIIFDMNRP